MGDGHEVGERKGERTDAAPEVDPRVLMAAERTLLAWVRTGIALMGFGFVVARFGFFLREIEKVGGGDGDAKPERFHASAIGIGLVAAGLLLNLWASFRHRRRVHRMTSGQPFESSPTGPVVMGIATAVGGVVLVGILLSTLLR